MKRFTIALLACFGLAVGSAHAVIISSSAASAGPMPHLMLFPRESLTYTLTGNFTGNIVLEASVDGVNYVPTSVSATSSSTVTGTFTNGNFATLFRWNVLKRTTGTFVTELRDNEDYVGEVDDLKKTPVLTYFDTTIHFPAKMATDPNAVTLSSMTAINVDSFKSIFEVINSTGAAITLGATPTVSTTNVAEGTTYIIQSATDTVTFQDNGTLAGSALELGAATRQLGVGDILVLIYRASKWWEMGFYNN